MNRKHFLIASLSLAGAATLVGWAAAQGKNTFTDPAQGGPDYLIQGEYAGRAGDAKLGAQVIALGNGTFRAVFLPGGLPGDGWDRKTRVQVEGKTEGEETHFGKAGEGWSACVLEKGTLQGNTETGQEFRLRRIVRESPTLRKKAPDGATVLFDGTSADAWQNGRVSPEGLLEAGTRTKQSFGDFSLHFEFRTPFQPAARGQGRGNSGLYLQDRYEIQILDSFGLEGRNNECGGIYSQKAPDLNMCYPPLAWQTYDIDFQAARFEEGKKVKNAIVTIRHNGVVIHDKVELAGPTGGGKPESADGGAFQIQDHGNPVHVRNVWVLSR